MCCFSNLMLLIMNNYHSDIQFEIVFAGRLDHAAIRCQYAFADIDFE